MLVETLSCFSLLADTMQERSAGATSSSDLKNSTMYTEPKARIQVR